LADSTSYWFENLERFEGNFIPSEQDILRVRIRSAGVKEVNVKMDEKVWFNFIDVGGQRSERRKWIHCFDQVDTVLFCSSLSEYNQNLFEDHSVNRLEESLSLFGEIAKSEWFLNKSLILFLNKKDLFDQKILLYRFSSFFPSYNGSNDPEEILKFIVDLFRQQFKNRGSNVSLYYHITCATDTDNVRLVFPCVKDIIISSSIRSMGI